MATNQKKKPTTYTYESVDGSKSTIQVGRDGVTKEWLAFLMEDDAAMREQDDVQRKHADYTFQNAVARFERNPGDDSDHPTHGLTPGSSIVVKAEIPSSFMDYFAAKNIKVTHVDVIAYVDR